jgi:hypothetical protein
MLAARLGRPVMRCIKPGAVNLSLPMKRKQLVLRDLYWSAR